jgi:hypothetical protein
MSALLLELKPVAAAVSAGCGDRPRPLAVAAAIAGALAPWLLVVGAYGGLARSAASCLAGPLPV